MALFSDLLCWVDPIVRSGAENMAVDQWLMETVGEKPLLRIYQWNEPTVTLGYFESLADAKRDFSAPDLTYVRRWTGGGIVDHREDWTYSLFFPKGHAIEQLRGNASYERIHELLASAMQQSGVECRLTLEEDNAEARACFVHPVPYDIVSPSGKKLAGAGQKRSRYGLLHQGSVQGVSNAELLGETLCGELAAQVEWVSMALPETKLQEIMELRYSNDAWLLKRP